MFVLIIGGVRDNLVIKDGPGGARANDSASHQTSHLILTLFYTAASPIRVPVDRTFVQTPLLIPIKQY